MKLILIPLAVLVIISLVSMTGLGSTLQDRQWVDFANNADGTPKILYDSSGTATCYYNGTAVAGRETGDIAPIEYSTLAGWDNNTATVYALFYDAAATDPAQWQNVMNPMGFGSHQSGYAFNLAGSLGMIGLLVALVAVGTFVGLHFFGSGLSKISVDLLFKSTAYIAVWGVFSALAYPLIFGTGEFILYITYFGLTIVYVLGIVNSVGHPSGDF